MNTTLVNLRRNSPFRSITKEYYDKINPKQSSNDNLIIELNNCKIDYERNGFQSKRSIFINEDEKDDNKKTIENKDFSKSTITNSKVKIFVKLNGANQKGQSPEVLLNSRRPTKNLSVLTNESLFKVSNNLEKLKFNINSRKSAVFPSKPESKVFYNDCQENSSEKSNDKESKDSNEETLLKKPLYKIRLSPNLNEEGEEDLMRRKRKFQINHKKDEKDHKSEKVSSYRSMVSNDEINELNKNLRVLKNQSKSKFLSEKTKEINSYLKQNTFSPNVKQKKFFYKNEDKCIPSSFKNTTTKVNQEQTQLIADDNDTQKIFFTRDLKNSTKKGILKGKPQLTLDEVFKNNEIVKDNVKRQLEIFTTATALDTPSTKRSKEEKSEGKTPKTMEFNQNSIKDNAEKKPEGTQLIRRNQTKIFINSMNKRTSIPLQILKNLLMKSIASMQTKSVGNDNENVVDELIKEFKRRKNKNLKQAQSKIMSLDLKLMKKTINYTEGVISNSVSSKLKINSKHHQNTNDSRSKRTRELAISEENRRDCFKIMNLLKLLPGFKKYMLYNSITEEAVVKTAEHLVYITVKPGKYIYYEGDEPDGFYCLLSGRVEITKNSFNFNKFSILTQKLNQDIKDDEEDFSTPIKTLLAEDTNQLHLSLGSESAVNGIINPNSTKNTCNNNTILDYKTPKNSQKSGHLKAPIFRLNTINNLNSVLGRKSSNEEENSLDCIGGRKLANNNDDDSGSQNGILIQENQDSKEQTNKNNYTKSYQTLKKITGNNTNLSKNSKKVCFADHKVKKDESGGVLTKEAKNGNYFVEEDNKSTRSSRSKSLFNKENASVLVNEKKKDKESHSKVVVEDTEAGILNTNEDENIVDQINNDKLEQPMMINPRKSYKNTKANNQTTPKNKVALKRFFNMMSIQRLLKIDEKIKTVNSGEVFGDSGLVDNTKRSENAVTVTECRLFKIEKAIFEFYFKKCLKIAELRNKELFKILIPPLRKLNESIFEWFFKTTNIMTYDKGRVIYNSKSPCEYIYIVFNGECISKMSTLNTDEAELEVSRRKVSKKKKNEKQESEYTNKRKDKEDSQSDSESSGSKNLNTIDMFPQSKRKSSHNSAYMPNLREEANNKNKKKTLQQTIIHCKGDFLGLECLDVIMDSILSNPSLLSLINKELIEPIALLNNNSKKTLNKESLSLIENIFDSNEGILKGTNSLLFNPLRKNTNSNVTYEYNNEVCVYSELASIMKIHVYNLYDPKLINIFIFLKNLRDRKNTISKKLKEQSDKNKEISINQQMKVTYNRNALKKATESNLKQDFVKSIIDIEISKCFKLKEKQAFLATKGLQYEEKASENENTHNNNNDYEEIDCVPQNSKSNCKSQVTREYFIDSNNNNLNNLSPFSSRLNINSTKIQYSNNKDKFDHLNSSVNNICMSALGKVNEVENSNYSSTLMMQNDVDFKDNESNHNNNNNNDNQMSLNKQDNSKVKLLKSKNKETSKQGLLKKHYSQNINNEEESRLVNYKKENITGGFIKTQVSFTSKNNNYLTTNCCNNIAKQTKELCNNRFSNNCTINDVDRKRYSKIKHSILSSNEIFMTTNIRKPSDKRSSGLELKSAFLLNKNELVKNSGIFKTQEAKLTKKKKLMSDVLLSIFNPSNMGLSFLEGYYKEAKLNEENSNRKAKLIKKVSLINSTSNSKSGVLISNNKDSSKWKSTKENLNLNNIISNPSNSHPKHRSLLTRTTTLGATRSKSNKSVTTKSLLMRQSTISKVHNNIHLNMINLDTNEIIKEQPSVEGEGQNNQSSKHVMFNLNSEENNATDPKNTLVNESGITLRKESSLIVNQNSLENSNKILSIEKKEAINSHSNSNSNNNINNNQENPKGSGLWIDIENIEDFHNHNNTRLEEPKRTLNSQSFPSNTIMIKLNKESEINNNQTKEVIINTSTNNNNCNNNWNNAGDETKHFNKTTKKVLLYMNSEAHKRSTNKIANSKLNRLTTTNLAKISDRSKDPLTFSEREGNNNNSFCNSKYYNKNKAFESSNLQPLSKDYYTTTNKEVLSLPISSTMSKRSISYYNGNFEKQLNSKFSHLTETKSCFNINDFKNHSKKSFVQAFPKSTVNYKYRLSDLWLKEEMRKHKEDFKKKRNSDENACLLSVEKGGESIKTKENPCLNTLETTPKSSVKTKKQIKNAVLKLLKSSDSFLQKIQSSTAQTTSNSLHKTTMLMQLPFFEKSAVEDNIVNLQTNSTLDQTRTIGSFHHLDGSDGSGSAGNNNKQISIKNKSKNIYHDKRISECLENYYDFYHFTNSSNSNNSQFTSLSNSSKLTSTLKTQKLLCNKDNTRNSFDNNTRSPKKLNRKSSSKSKDQVLIGKNSVQEIIMNNELKTIGKTSNSIKKANQNKFKTKSVKLVLVNQAKNIFNSGDYNLPLVTKIEE